MFLGEDEEEAWGWPSPRSPARKRWSRWWRSSSTSSSAGPPSNSGENVVDLVRRGGFFLHSLMEKRASGREELLCEKKDYRKGRGRWLRWESDGAWTRAVIRGSTSLQRRHAHRWFSRTVREGEADSRKKKVT